MREIPAEVREFQPEVLERQRTCEHLKIMMDDTDVFNLEAASSVAQGRTFEVLMSARLTAWFDDEGGTDVW